MRPVRIATWNVNSLKARLEKVTWWLERARPDVLLVQETKLADPDAPTDAFRSAGYALAHHGEGLPLGRGYVGAAVTGRGVPHVDVLGRHVEVAAEHDGLARISRRGGRLIRASPSCSAATSTWRPRTSTCGTPRPVTAAPTYPRPSGRPSPWDYRAGNFHKNFGMRIDHLLVTAPVLERTVWTEIDREARKGKPVPSDHAPLVIDIDERGRPFDAGWAAAEGRIAARRSRPR